MLDIGYWIVNTVFEYRHPRSSIQDPTSNIQHRYSTTLPKSRIIFSLHQNKGSPILRLRKLLLQLQLCSSEGCAKIVGTIEPLAIEDGHQFLSSVIVDFPETHDYCPGT